MESSQASVQSVKRIFSIIEILSAEPKGMPLLEISKQSNLAKSTVHRLLSSLITLGYVVQDSYTSTYRLTLKMFEISSNVVNDIDIVAAARPYLDNLSLKTGAAVHLVVRNGAYVVYVYKAQASNAALRMASHVGLRAPMYCTGVGKAILATMSESEIDTVWSKTKVERYTDKTITDLNELKNQLSIIRRRGWAEDDEENELGIRCVAVALSQLAGQAQAAFSISGLAPQMNPQRTNEIAQLSLQAKQDIIHATGR